MKTRKAPALAVQTLTAAALFTGAVGAAAPAFADTKPRAGAVSGAYIKVEVPHNVQGSTLNYRYQNTGKQHLVTNWANPSGAEARSDVWAFDIDFGDGAHDTGEPGAWKCLHNDPRLTPFKHDLGWRSHTYSKPGTYKVTVKTTYCGDSLAQSVNTKTFYVTVPGKSGSATTGTA